MERYEAISLIRKLKSKVTCMIMEEIIRCYKEDSDYEHFELDYDYIKSVLLYEMLCPPKATTPSSLTSPCETSEVGLNLYMEENKSVKEFIKQRTNIYK